MVRKKIRRKGGEAEVMTIIQAVGDKETQEGILETPIDLNDCLSVLAWAGNERRNSEVPVTRQKVPEDQDWCEKC